MKQMKFMLMALAVLLSVSLTSCMNSENSDSQGAGIFRVVNGGLTTYFEAENGIKIYPYPSSLTSIESQMGFSTSSTKVAYIIYSYDTESADNANYETTKTLYVTLKYAVAVDAPVRVTTPGASADSISTSPIIALGVIDGTKELAVLGDRYLLLGINYYTSGNLVHNFTLVNYAEENTDNEIKLYLRHTGTPEAATTNFTSANYAGNYPFIYFYAFDLNYLLSDYQYGRGAVKITVEADVNSSNPFLNDVSTQQKLYSLDYTFTN